MLRRNHRLKHGQTAGDPVGNEAVKNVEIERIPDDFGNYITELEAFIFWLLNKKLGIGEKKFNAFLNRFDPVLRAYSAELMQYKTCDHHVFQMEIANLGYTVTNRGTIEVDHKKKQHNGKYKKKGIDDMCD